MLIVLVWHDHFIYIGEPLRNKAIVSLLYYIYFLLFKNEKYPKRSKAIKIQKSKSSKNWELIQSTHTSVCVQSDQCREYARFFSVYGTKNTHANFMENFRWCDRTNKYSAKEKCRLTNESSKCFQIFFFTLLVY